MKTSHSILIDLAAGQSTIEPLAERLRLPSPVIVAFLADLITDGLVESSSIGNPEVGRKLTVYRLTAAGREAAAEILQPA
jgi:predicted ArsR family transcriptional regulator